MRYLTPVILASLLVPLALRAQEPAAPADNPLAPRVVALGKELMQQINRTLDTAAELEDTKIKLGKVAGMLKQEQEDRRKETEDLRRKVMTDALAAREDQKSLDAAEQAQVHQDRLNKVQGGPAVEAP